MKIQYILIQVALILFCVSCVQDLKCTQNYEFNLDAQESDTIFYSQIADSISYLNLDTAGTNHIQHFTDMVITPHDIYIWDNEQKCIWNFNHNGSFKRCLNKRGHGPGEYISIRQFEYDSIMRELLVLDAKCILHYDLDFNFIIKEELDEYASDFKLVGDYYFLSSLGHKAEYSGVYIFDKREKKSRKIISKEEDICWNDSWEIISWGDTIAVTAPPLRNTLYHFKGITPIDTIEITTPRSGRTYQFTDDSFEFQDHRRTIFMESSSWVYMVFWKNKELLQNIVLNKNTGQQLKGSVLYNDMDFVDRSYCLSYSEGNTFSFIVEKENNEGMAIQFLHLKK